MLRFISKMAIRRRFSQSAAPTVTKSLIDFAAQFRVDKSIIHSPIYQALEQVYEYQQRINISCENLTILQQETRSRKEPTNFALMRQYFVLRKELGFNEQVLAHTLFLLTKQEERGYDFDKIGTDVFGQDLLDAPMFGYLIDDLKMLAIEQLEVDVDAVKLAIRSLSILGYKDFELVKQLTEKVLKMTNLTDPTLFSKVTSVDSYFLRPNLQNYVQAPQASTFKNALKSIIGIKGNPGRAVDALAYIKTCDEISMSNLSEVMTRLETLLQQFSILNLDFMHTLSSIKEYYADLRSPERQEFLKQNPDLLIDFLRLEKKLIMCNLLIPKNLLEPQSENFEEVKMMFDLLLFQLKIDPNLISLIVRTSGMVAEAEGAGAPNAQEAVPGDIQPNLVYSAILSCFDEMFNHSREKLVSVNPEDDYQQQNLPGVIGGFSNTYKATKEDIYGKRDTDALLGGGFETDGRRAAVAHFGYSKMFQYLSDRFVALYESFKNNSQPGTLNLEQFDLTLLVQTFILARKAARNDIAAEVSKMITETNLTNFSINSRLCTAVAENLDIVSMDVLTLVFKQPESEELLLNYITEVLNNAESTFSSKVSALYLGVAFATINATIWASHQEFLSKLSKLVQTTLTDDALSAIYVTRPGRDLPLPRDYFKYFVVLNFVKQRGSVFGKGDADTINKTLARVTHLLNLDWEMRIPEDPAFATIWKTVEGLAGKHDSKANKLPDIPFLPAHLKPILLIGGSKKALFLLRADEYSDTVQTQLIMNVFKGKTSVQTSEAISVREFFADSNYHREKKFELIENLEDVISEKLDVTENEALQLNEEFIQALDYKETDNRFYRRFADGFLAVLSRLNQKRKWLTATYNPDQELRLLNQYYFLALYLESKIRSDFPQKRVLEAVHLRSALKHQIDKLNAAGGKKTSPQLKNRLFGFEPYDLPEGQTEPILDILNYKFFSNSDYFVFDSWRKSLLPELGPVQYAEGKYSFFGKLGQLKQVILPNVNDRRLTRPSFQLFWEEVVHSTSQERRERALKYENLARKQSQSSLKTVQRWQLSLLNFLYELRAKEDVVSVVKRLAAMDCWEKLANALTAETDKTPAEQQSHDSMFVTEDVNYYFDSSVPSKKQKSQYEVSMTEKQRARDKVRNLQTKLKTELPELFRTANSESARRQIFQAYINTQQEYIAELENYKTIIDPTDNVGRDSYFKDLLYTFEGVAPNEQTSDQKVLGNTTKFLSGDKTRAAFVETFAVRFALTVKSKSQPLSQVEQDYLKSQKDNRLEIVRVNIPKSPLLSSRPLSEFLSKADIEFLDSEFPNSKIGSFTDQPIDGFLTAFSVIGDLGAISHLSNKETLEAEVQKLLPGKHSEQLLADLIDTVTFFPPNSARFYQNYIERRAWLRAISITPEDQKTFTEMLSIMRGLLTRGLSFQQKMAAARPRRLRKVHRALQQRVRRAAQRLHQMLPKQTLSAKNTRSREEASWT